MKILLIEDEKPVADYIAGGLRDNQFTADIANDGKTGLERARTIPYDLIILDLLLPGIDGYEILSKLRKESYSVPVLILTAKGSISDRVKGLNLGADDYLAKPFAFEELIARINALLRRSKKIADPLLTADDLTMDVITHTVTRSNKVIELTSREYSLLEFFLYNKGRVLTRAIISEHVWDYQFDMGTNIIEVYINRLRNKIDADSQCKLFHTVRGFGYVLKESGQ